MFGELYGYSKCPLCRQTYKSHVGHLCPARAAGIGDEAEKWLAELERKGDAQGS